jgi:hypothetical protein
MKQQLKSTPCQGLLLLLLVVSWAAGCWIHWLAERYMGQGTAAALQLLAWPLRGHLPAAVMVPGMLLASQQLMHLKREAARVQRGGRLGSWVHVGCDRA